MRAVVDNNIWVSGAFSESSGPARLVAAFLAQGFTLISSEPLLEEAVEVLERPRILRRSRLTRAEIRDLIQAMRDLGEVFAITGEVHVCRDSDDDKVIETALVGHADVVVSGDQDLTRAPEVAAFLAPAGIRVLTVTQFLAELEEADE